MASKSNVRIPFKIVLFYFLFKESMISANQTEMLLDVASKIEVSSTCLHGV